ncbi:MAG: transcriptional repressor [Nitrosopumilus sp.]|nr:transcriptional repressor [Nitrosopumilus sp.]MDH3487741.1 transcriptional repressor [Nitrosopumilus sp.]
MRDFRITPQRIVIVDYLLKTEEHPSTEYIHKTIQKKIPHGKPIYSIQNPWSSKREKLVNEIEVEGETRFDAHTDEHINLVCINCGKIEDIDEDLLKEIQSRAAKKSKYLIVKGSFEMFGYCNSCKSKFN